MFFLCPQRHSVCPVILPALGRRTALSLTMIVSWAVELQFTSETGKSGLVQIISHLTFLPITQLRGDHIHYENVAGLCSG